MKKGGERPQKGRNIPVYTLCCMYSSGFSLLRGAIPVIIAVVLVPIKVSFWEGSLVYAKVVLWCEFVLLWPANKQVL